MAFQRSFRRTLVLKAGIFSLLLVSYSCTSAPKAPESAGTEEQAPSGKELFEQNCASCHGTDGKLGNSGAKDLTKSNLSDPEILKIIEEGKNGMPPMKGILETDENIVSVQEYIKKLRK